MTTQPRPASSQPPQPHSNSGSDAVSQPALPPNHQEDQIAPPAADQSVDSPSFLTWRGSGLSTNQNPYDRAAGSSPLMNWFHNMPIRRKQLLALFATEAVSIIGLVGVGSWLIVHAGRTQLLTQAKSEVAVTEVAYNIKINQMGFGFRGQSENTAIIQAAKEHTGNRSINSTLQAQVRGILANEVKVREIEYATLVGTDSRIISSANADRTGEEFDPQGLVSTVIANPRQIKTSALVSWAELEKESPLLPNGFKKQDALIRYVITPVKDPQTKSLIGVLVAGDVVNNKLPIVQTALAAFQNGYSAIYQRQPNGEYIVTSSLDLGKATELDQAMVNVPLPDSRLLELAATAPGESVTQRVQMGDRTYTMAAQAITNLQNQPVGVLVRGTSEQGLNHMLQQSLLYQMIIAALAIAFDIMLAGVLGRSIAKPIERLRQVALQFAQGDRKARAPVFAADETGELTLAFNNLADNVVSSEAILREQSQRQQSAAERSKLMADITGQIRRSLDPEEILSVSVEGVRTLLQADRVLIYRFNPDYKSGKITTESVGDSWIKGLGQTIHDPLTPESIKRYKVGRISTVENLAEAELSHCHCEILERLQVKANIAAPILVGEDLVALLCAHQCSQPRVWNTAELEVVQQLSTQIGYALTQSRLLQQQKMIAERERQVNVLVAKMRAQLEPELIFDVVVKEVQAALAVERVIIYQFDQQWQGMIVAEAVEPGWTAALKAQIKDPCFAEKYVDQYKNGRIQATSNIYEAGLTECHLKILEPYQVKANLVAPITTKDNLLGLLIAHQCSTTRNWEEAEIRFIRQVATQLGFALEQAKLFTQKEQARLEAEALSEARQQQKEALQRQLVDLLGHVEGAARGDLTVRVEVTTGEIGTVADFFNAIIESLRQIVTQVKRSAIQVNAALGQNEDEIQQLANQAYQQAEETTRILDSVEQMTQSIQAVAESARQAAQVARTASMTAETGGNAMDLTVHNILGLREIIGDTAKKVKRLGESSQQISRVVSLINQIAVQTNLLAINAGLEAAKAGEEGQGFAIVAEEVGELAARSAEATQEIEKVVATIQQETSQVVEAMEQSTVRVVEGTKLVEEAKRSLQEIVDVSRQIDELVQSISEATVSQVATSAAVSQVMQQVTLVSEHTSSSSRQVATAIQQTAAIAQELQASVEAFKVDAEHRRKPNS